MQFTYKGWDGSGRPTQGMVEAASREEAIGQLTQGGLLIAECRTQTKLSLNVELSGPKRPQLGDLAAFCSQLAMLVGAGVPVLQSLRVLANQNRKGGLGRILSDAAADVEAGRSLSQALHKHKKLLPWVLIQVGSVAEITGSLDIGLRLLGKQFEQEELLRRRVKSAMTYPAVVVVAAIAVVSFMVTFVVPKYADLFDQLGASLPTSTQMVLSLSNFVRHDWPVLLLLIGAAVAAIWALFRLHEVRFVWSRYVLYAPVLGEVLLKREIARLARMLATLVHSGVPILSALEVVEGAMGNLWLASRLHLATETVRVGGSLAGALREHQVLPGMMMELLAVGEVIGDVEGMLGRIGDSCENDVNLIVDGLSSIIEPVLVIVLGAAVVSIIVPIILPMFDIYQHVGQ